jgi:hypothetical protein
MAVALEVADDDLTHDRLVVDNEHGGHIAIVGPKTFHVS